MQWVADLHLHSKYSRAVSKDMNLTTMSTIARQKGIDLLTATDFTHPMWFKELTTQLEERSEGLYTLKSKKQKDVLFLLSTEISSIYKEGEKLRRIHNLVFMPNLAAAQKFTKALLDRGANLSADGRPIIGLSSRSLLELLLEVDERAFLIPAHVWTPHFGVYGSASGYDSLEEAFGDLSQYIYGIETGLSSDPEMNWQMAELTNRSILSFSDAHSAGKMGRELTVFVDKNGMTNDKLLIANNPIAYEDIRLAIMRKPGKLRVGYTIEFYPEEGKYHYSGHRNCGVVLKPDEIKKQSNICPVCHRRLTEGVLFRVEQLAGESGEGTALLKENDAGLVWLTDPNKQHPPYVKLVPLLEVVAESFGMTVGSKKVQELYTRLVTTVGSELDILLRTPIGEIEKVGGEKLGQAICRVRGGEIIIAPGYDGVYGKVSLWPGGEQSNEKEQLSLL